ncbi:MAG TPA: hypothetical protein DCO79_10480, partial [Spirochaeta sp.]|nr:hypothetical protein [Spirochaeta sp.]
LTESLSVAGAAERDINGYFNEYNLNLNPLYSFMFRNSHLSLYLKSYQSKIIDTGTISQFEIGDTGIFFDFTFMIRPREQYSLPFFHGDALKALPGVDGALYMDFYSFENTMDLDAFFGQNVELIERAMKLAAPYWKHEGFGELTAHLDEYKSPYRFEILEPEKVAEDERAEYFKTVRECFNLYSNAYLNSLKAHEADESLEDAALNSAEINGFVDILYEHDIAVRMGKMIFPEEDFDRYFLEGFWGVR